jgi:hypothetical protein
MVENLARDFLGQQAESMAGEQLHGHVGRMVQQSPNESVLGAVGQALGVMGPGGFGQSVEHGTKQAQPQQRNQLADLLLNAVEQGGGSRQAATSRFGNTSSMSPEGLGQLAAQVAENHPQALASVLGNHMNQTGGQGGMMGLLGNPMVRQIGMHLAEQAIQGR